MIHKGNVSGAMAHLTTKDFKPLGFNEKFETEQDKKFRKCVDMLPTKTKWKNSDIRKDCRC